MQRNLPLVFLVLGLLALIVGISAGVLLSITYIVPDFMEGILPFNQLRPIHITFVVSWIILTATGGIYYYLGCDFPWSFPTGRSVKIHLMLFFVLGFGILASYFLGKMGGREYLVFPPAFIPLILLGWLLFAFAYFKTLTAKVRNWPVYYWMWGTGIVFMIFHLSESNFWFIQSIRSDYIKDITIQWKSYGSFVGSWNMLVYGTATYVMAKISGKENPGRGKLVFFFYFLGLSNLMFGWAHHTYLIPTLPWVRYVAYATSMTEWIIFINIVRNWNKSLSKPIIEKYKLAHLFINASDVWVFLNLLMALLISIPAINYYTHGTHITVAHSMGTTIGINTMILFASLSYVLVERGQGVHLAINKFWFYLLNWSLLVFWVTLIVMGIVKAYYTTKFPDLTMQEIHSHSWIYYLIFMLTGLFVFTALLGLSFSYLKKLVPLCTYMLLPQNVKDVIDKADE